MQVEKIKIIKELHSENCFDGTYIKEYKLDEKINEDFVGMLRNFGKMTYLSNLKNPFFSLDKNGFFTIKGILNDDEVRVIYVRKNMERSSKFLFGLIQNFDKDNALFVIKELEKKIAGI
ncbi:MAG: hypothetical protein WCW64_00510 [Phycisphaerae bacterium]|jgi:hypothetical protein